MNKHLKSVKVWDKCTCAVGVIESSFCQKNDDGKWVRYYKIKDVPVTENYPSGWRHAGEISINQAYFARAQN